MARIAIVGLGLIGGSLGLALKRAGLQNLEIAGFDAAFDVGSRARKLGAIDQAPRDLPSTVEGAAVVVIATPIAQVGEALEAVAPHLGGGAVVTDTASTKRDILQAAERLLPDHVSFVGGHPIAGKEHSGIDAADADLFQGRAWAITPSMRATEEAIKTVESLVSVIGAQPMIIDPDEHDSYMAAVSHVPLVASTALFALARDSQAWEDLGALAGPGFRDLTRLASTSPELSRDILLSNRDNVLHWLDRLLQIFQTLRQQIDGSDAEQLETTFGKAQEAREAFLKMPPVRAAPEQQGDRVSAGEQMMTLIVGEYVVRKTKEIERLAEEREQGQR